MAGASSDEYESDHFSESSSEDKSSEDSDANIDLKEIKTYFRVDLMYNNKNEGWPRKTYLHYKLDLNNQTKSDRLFNLNENDVKTHAEEKLLKILNEKVVITMLSDVRVSSDTSPRSKKKMKMELEMLMNYSPCKDCADKIKAFKEENEKYFESDISLTFGTFYLLYPKTDKNGHIEGLAELLNAGIKLQLVWDYECLKETIEQIGSKKDREKREKVDRDYMQLVIEKAEKLIAD